MLISVAVRLYRVTKKIIAVRIAFESALIAVQTRRVRCVRGPLLPPPPSSFLGGKGSVGAIGDLIRLYFVLIHKYIWRESESAAGTIKRLIAVQFVINKSGERPRRGVAPLSAARKPEWEIFPGREHRLLVIYNGREGGGRKERSVYKMTRESTLEKASIFRVFLPPSSNLPSSPLSFIDP